MPGCPGGSARDRPALERQVGAVEERLENEAALGKRVGKDSDRGKVTYPAVLGVDESVRYAAQLVDEACEALVPLGSQAAHLEALARYVLERNH